MKLDTVFVAIIGGLLLVIAFSFGKSMGDSAGYKRAEKYYKPAVDKYEQDARDRNDKIKELEIQSIAAARDISNLRSYIELMAKDAMTSYDAKDQALPTPKRNDTALESNEIDTYNAVLDQMRSALEP